MNISKLTLEVLIGDLIANNLMEIKSINGEVTFKPYYEEMFVNVFDEYIEVRYYLDHFKTVDEYYNTPMKNQENLYTFGIRKGAEYSKENAQSISDRTYIDINSIGTLIRLVNEM